MADTHGHDGFILVNVFSVVPSSGREGKFDGPQFIKRGLMPLSFIVAKLPIFIDDKQYEQIETCYDLGHREAMLFVYVDPKRATVVDAAAAAVPDVARYGAQSH